MAEDNATSAPDHEAGAESQEMGALPNAAEPRSEPPHPFDFLVDIPLRLTVELGSSRILLREVLQLNKGSVIELDRHSSDPVDILVNGRRLARGEVTMVDDRLAVRVVEVMGIDEGGEVSR